MDKNELIIYEGAMCCSTGVCGPEPDQTLIAFSEALKRLQHEYGDHLTIMRASLTFNSLIFLSHPQIARLVKEKGPDILPITTINGEIIAKQRYLKYEDISKHLQERDRND
jgi:hypothetical protein